MNELTPIQKNDNAIPAKLDVAKRALAEATTDWERIDIRDYARAVAAATAILERKDIQVQAANLVQDAERAIAKANPSMHERERERLRAEIINEASTNAKDAFIEEDKNLEIVTENLVTVDQLRKMRQAHNHISDEEFEAKKLEAEKTGVPLTQASLREDARRKRIEKVRQDALEKTKTLTVHHPNPNPDEKERKEHKIPDKKKLNDLTAQEWIIFSKSWFTLKNPGLTDREKIAVHPATFPNELASDYIRFFTKPGESVLDPFLGAGTTMEVAEQMGRLSTGIELDQAFAEFASNRTSHPIIIGDALTEIYDTEKFEDESFDYVFTSPPYWNTLHKSRGGNKDTRHKQRQERDQFIVYSDSPEDLGNIDDVNEYLKQLVTLFS